MVNTNRPFDLRAVEALVLEMQCKGLAYEASALQDVTDALREMRAALSEIINAPNVYQRDTAIRFARQVLASVTDGPVDNSD